MPHTITELTPLQKQIRDLAKAKNAVILAHYYQRPEIQQVADFVGDSLGLSQEAARTKSDIIVFAGVHFMAETAKILNPDRKVLLPDLSAGCSLADSCPPSQFSEFLKEHPDHLVISYINCSAEIKAMSDLICTSANAIDVVNSVPAGQAIIFAPDKNLGHYVAEQTGREFVLWDGACTVHEAFSIDKIRLLQIANPGSRLVVHPESQADLLAMADFIGSTTAMIRYIAGTEAPSFIVATEAGILHKVRESAPDKLLIAAPAVEDNSCACSECPYMKLNTLDKLLQCLQEETPEIVIPESTRRKALLPLERMLALSAVRPKRISMRC